VPNWSTLARLGIEVDDPSEKTYTYKDWSGPANLVRRYEAMDKEIEQLRAVVRETLAQNERFDKRYRDAEAEVERLRAKFHTLNQDATAHVSALEAENERLRATLRDIEGSTHPLEMRRLASDALRST
jgi:chromosome segregation ATPase